MHRRQFLQNALIGAVVPSLASSRLALAADVKPASTPQETPAKLRGVNLGSWLVLEKWMTPSVFRYSQAPDEYTLCRDLGAKAAQRLNRHRETFITPADFRWIKDHGLNAIRLPVGHWVLDAPAPFVSAARFLDFAFEQAQQNNLQVLLDLHGAPGSQNGMDHSGKSGPLEWHTSVANIAQTIDVLESLAKRYGKHPALWGIELLNEPRWDVPIDILKTFYQDAYKRIRPHLPARVAVVVHDGFRPFEWKNFMQEPQYSNVLLDTHIYQAYTDADRKRTAQQHITEALNRKNQLDAMSGQLWTTVGEWSLGTPNEVWRGLSRFEIETGKRAYGDAQLLSYEATKGWFYWSYKLENDSDWNFRTCVERGYLPSNFADVALKK